MVNPLMRNLTQALYVELLKARRSRVSLFSALGFALLPLVGGFFMIVLKDPELAQRVGLISAKARILAGAADWPTYLELLAQAQAVGGLILFGFIGSWVFGREYTDRTAKDLLALPTPRAAIVAAKFGVIALWSAALVILVLLLGFGIGALIGLAQASPPLLLLQGALSIVIAAFLTIALVTPVAFFASAGHGYLAPLGFVFLTLLLAQVVAVAGWGEYFPWSIPALLAQGEPLGLISYVIVAATCVAGIAATWLWWVLADQTH
jgi:ABC-2 type transport system permease protein